MSIDSVGMKHAMFVTQKCQYALRAMFVLARRVGQGPIKIAQVAEEQAIPFRFLEVILGQLRQGGFVESRRGTDGGYLLAREPEAITVGDIVRFIDGHIHADPALVPENGRGRPRDREVGAPSAGAAPDILDAVWHQARCAVFGVFDGQTLADLLAADAARSSGLALHYEI